MHRTGLHNSYPAQDVSIAEAEKTSGSQSGLHMKPMWEALKIQMFMLHTDQLHQAGRGGSPVSLVF